MSKNNSKNKKLIEKQRLRKEKMLQDMQSEIKDIENQIKHVRANNIKIGTIRNLKISARVLQLVAPYLVTAGIVAGGFTLLGDIPFYGGDKFREYSNIMTEFDNKGNIRYEQQYDSFSNDKNQLYYYTKWEKNEDGLYSRSVQTYSIKKKTYEEILELFNKDNLKLEDILGEPSSKTKETKNNLTEEELKDDAFIKAIIYNKDENDYIIRKETVGENILVSVLYILITFVICSIPNHFRHEYSSFDFSNCVAEIKRNHHPVDIKTLTKKLELKKENYDRLTR